MEKSKFLLILYEISTNVQAKLCYIFNLNGKYFNWSLKNSLFFAIFFTIEELLFKFEYKIFILKSKHNSLYFLVNSSQTNPKPNN